MKIKIMMLIGIIAVTIISCTKSDIINEPKNFLKFSSATVHISNKKGSTAVVKVQSDVTWKLTIETPLPDWMSINKYSGVSSDSLLITALTDNTTGGYKFAKVIATAVNRDNILPVYLTVVQYDSTVKVK